MNLKTRIMMFDSHSYHLYVTKLKLFDLKEMTLPEHTEGETVEYLHLKWTRRSDIFVSIMKLI